MFLNLFKRAVAYIKDLHEMALFTIMSNEGVFYVFTGTPLYYVMMPMIGILLTVSSLVKGYELSKAKNKRLDPWLDFIASALTATLASISLYGSVVATYLGLNFALGPWFFLAGIGVSLIHQLTMTGLNVFRACQFVKGSIPRMHYVQASFNNVFNLGLLTAISGAVLFIMISPIAPAIGSACALTAVAINGLNVLWRMMPYNWKRGIKEFLGLGKPQLNLIQAIDFKIPFDLRNTKLSEIKQSEYFPKMFTSMNLSATVQHEAFRLSEEIPRKVLISDGVTWADDSLLSQMEFFKRSPLPYHRLSVIKEGIDVSGDAEVPYYTEEIAAKL